MDEGGTAPLVIFVVALMIAGATLMTGGLNVGDRDWASLIRAPRDMAHALYQPIDRLVDESRGAADDLHRGARRIGTALSPDDGIQPLD